MSEYSPDVWVIVKLSGNKVAEQFDGERSYYRVLAGWFGGFAGSNSWKMNSGITKIEDKGYYYDIIGETGSVYHCHKEAERFNSLTRSIFLGFVEQNCDDVMIEHVDMKDVVL